MARYERRAVGIDDRLLERVIQRSDAEWADYLAHWQAGGEVDAAPPPEAIVLPPEEVAARQELADRATMRAAMRADAVIQFLRTHTPAEAEAWVQANVTDLASARNALGKLAMIVAYLARERLANDR